MTSAKKLILCPVVFTTPE